jgi:hypothetical protein
LLSPPFTQTTGIDEIFFAHKKQFSQGR